MTTDRTAAYLASLVSNYVAPQSEEVQEAKSTKVLAVSMHGEKLVKVNRQRQAVDGSFAAPQALAAKAAPAVSKYIPLMAGTIDAAKFLEVIRNASKIQDNAARQTAEREALELFTGYVFGEPHGTQVDNARRSANAKVKGTGPDLVKVYGAGHVKGLPDAELKQVRNLTGRLNMALDTCNAIRKAIKDGQSVSDADLDLLREEERAEAIRADLDAHK